MQENLFRSNITEAEGGIPLETHYTVLDTSCKPVVDAFIDIWHCEYPVLASGNQSSMIVLSSFLLAAPQCH